MELDAVLAGLVADGWMDQGDANMIHGAASQDTRVTLHPLVMVANQKLQHATEPQLPLTLESLTRWIAEQAGLPYFHIDAMKVDVDKVTQIVSQAYARQYRILPVEVRESVVVIATSEPFDLSWMRDLSQILKRDIKVVISNPLDINRYMLEFYGVSRSIRGAEDSKLRSESERVLNFEQLLELGEAGQLSADDQHVVHIVDWLLQFAFEQRASDIHLEPRRERSKVRFRIDGRLHEVYQMPTSVIAAVTSRIKILGRMDVAEKRRPQDGRIKTRAPTGQEIELRLSTMPTAFGEKCVMRIFDPDVVARGFDKLGFSKREVGIWRNLVERPHGIVLLTGPTGSGKTTTLYSTLKYLARPDINVCTVEDPIEMVSPELNQMQVQRTIGVDFAAGVRTLLRQDPDIIMVGEIRDLDTAQMAIQASLTGHLVLSTLHTNDAPSAIIRLMDLGLPHYLLRGTLTGLVAQRLVRTLCPHCKKDSDISEDRWAALVQNWKIPRPQKISTPGGCTECRRTGYRGRTAIYEMLPIDEAVADAIQPDINHAAITQLAYKRGMRPLRVSAARKVAAGLTTIEEVMRVIPPSPVS
ncbi:MAG: GspE/PulE family protein [Xanthomonadales bacterium]|nr:GspE/PulE family protein [Xanthomonadales bacterium]